jgi:hypothetical protein
LGTYNAPTYTTITNLQANATTTGGGLILGTTTTSVSNNIGYGSNTARTAGKYYYECGIVSVNGTDAVGICNSSITTSGVLGSDNNGFGCRTSFGDVLLNNSRLGYFAVPYLPGGATLCIAVDLTAKLLWLRAIQSSIANPQNGLGWNMENDLSLQDPSTGTGGYDFSSITAGGGFYPCGYPQYAGTLITFNFGASPYKGIVPDGFLNWS